MSPYAWQVFVELVYPLGRTPGNWALIPSAVFYIVAWRGMIRLQPDHHTERLHNHGKRTTLAIGAQSCRSPPCPPSCSWLKGKRA
eukprot:1259775-Amphidinium_carterae.1